MCVKCPSSIVKLLYKTHNSGNKTSHQSQYQPYSVCGGVLAKEGNLFLSTGLLKYTEDFELFKDMTTLLTVVQLFACLAVPSCNVI